MTAGSLQTAWRDRLEAEPEHDALTFLDARGVATPHDRGDLHGRAARRGAALIEHGLTPGDVCVLALPSDPACAILVLGVLLAGGVPLLVAPPAMRRYESLAATLTHVVATTRPPVVVVTSDLHEQAAAALGGASSRVLTPDDLDSGLDSGSAELPSIAPDGNAIAAMQLTSGTTGLPRICVWTHAQVLAAVAGMVGAMRLRAEDRMLSWVPLYHDMGLVNNYVLCLTHGVPLAMMTPQAFIRRPALWLRGLSELRATHTWSPNFGFAVAASRIRDDELDDVRLDHVRGMWNAAERIHAETMRAFHRRFGGHGLAWTAMKANYGCAENIGGATFSDPDGAIVVDHVDGDALRAEESHAEPVNASAPGAVSIVSAGTPVPGLQIDIVSPAGEPLPNGHVGELALTSPSRMLGYLQRDGSIVAAPDPLRTGDLGYRRGDQVFWTGRLAETIVIRGRKLDPSEFERVLLAQSDMRPGSFVVFGVDDEALGTQRLVIATELRPGAPDRDRVIADLRAAVERELGLTLDDVVLMEKGTLTKTSSGKRRNLFFRDLYLRGQL